MLPNLHLNRISAGDRCHSEGAGKEPKPSRLFDERTFYPAFTKDLFSAKKEVIIYSPFVSMYRTDRFEAVVGRLTDRNVEVFIFTRPEDEYEPGQQEQARLILNHYEILGAHVYRLPGYVHAKAAVIDRTILWDGSLNILSQRESKEMMRRTEGETAARQVINYLGLNGKLLEAYRLKDERLSGLLGTRRKCRSVVPFFFLSLAIVVAVWLLLSTFIGFGTAKALVEVVEIILVRYHG